MALFGAVVLTLLSCAGAHVRGANGPKFMDVQYLNESDADELMSLASSQFVNATRLAALENILKATVSSLPRSEQGHLGHQTVRYVLHRYFLNQRGWLIKGLEPKGVQLKAMTQLATKDWVGWVPSYLQKRFEAQASQQKGLDVHDIAEMVATIEDLVRREADLALAEVYESLGQSTSLSLSRQEAEEVLDMYMLIFLTARNITFAEPAKNRRRLLNFKKRYRGFDEVHHWLEGVEMEFMPTPAKEFTYASMSKVVETIGDLFPEFNDQECVDLKQTMMKMEGGSRKAGRIPLADFYNKSLFSHWKFTESPEYLRDLGALDESDPLRPHVILSNYISSFNNCLRATSLYAVCCRSPCESLMSSLEEQVAGPSESPERLAVLVANLSTDTVAARAEGLEGKLLERLQSIASDDGKVPLHGRLFAQWMHHAFPRECPYPHEQGTTNPQTPDEWMASNGRSIAVSEEQLKQIAQDFCPSSGLGVLSADGDVQFPKCGGEEAEELPWSDQEELLDHRSVAAESAQAEEEPAPHYGFLMAICLPVALVLGFVVDQKLAQRGEALQRKGRFLMVSLAVALVGVATGLLDVRVAFGAGLLFCLWRRATAPRLLLPLAEKKVEL